MLKYELSKKLKEAGFPFKNDWESYNYIECGECGDGGQIGDDLPVTLSELIEACGDEFKRLDNLHDMNLFIAYSVDSIGKRGEGITPEEAVANLWLELIKGTNTSQDIL